VYPVKRRKGDTTVVNANKRKGSAAERACADWFADNGHPEADRRYGAGRHDDRGDLIGIVDTTIEVKNHQKLDLAGWVGELEREMENGGTTYGAVVVKRRGKSNPAEWYAVMTVELLNRLLTK